MVRLLLYTPLSMWGSALSAMTHMPRILKEQIIGEIDSLLYRIENFLHGHFIGYDGCRRIQSISELLKIDSTNIGITATTGEGLTLFGEGRGIQVISAVSVTKNEN